MEDSFWNHNALAAMLIDDALQMLNAWEGTAPPLEILLRREAPAEAVSTSADHEEVGGER